MVLLGASKLACLKSYSSALRNPHTVVEEEEVFNPYNYYSCTSLQQADTLLMVFSLQYQRS